MNGGVTQGVFHLCGANDLGAADAALRLEWLRIYMAWLTRHYRKLGRDPALIRDDVLAFGHEWQMLSTKTFDEMLYLYYRRLQILAAFQEAGAANDAEPYGPHPEAWTFARCESRPLRDRDLPSVAWGSPLARVSRVRVWPFAQLVAHLRPFQPSASLT